jgi:hypothetical protein
MARNTIINDIKVWKRDGETRVYVHTTDNREGCLYCTGNPWHAKGSKDGNLTPEEWKEAVKITNEYSSTGHHWTNVPEELLHGTRNSKPIVTNNRRTRCPDCGSYDCGANCNSNRW